MEWSLAHPYLTFILAFPTLFVVRCMFVAFGGGYAHHKHCEGCDCGPDDKDDDDDA